MELFNTPEEIKAAVANFKTLKLHPGWQSLKEIVDANIKVLEEQILNGIEDETKETIDRKRDKLRAYKEIIGTPDFWINKFESPQIVQQEEDPYYTTENLHKKNKAT